VYVCARARGGGGGAALRGCSVITRNGAALKNAKAIITSQLHENDYEILRGSFFFSFVTQPTHKNRARLGKIAAHENVDGRRRNEARNALRRSSVVPIII
jgi:hypothetical protein